MALLHHFKLLKNLLSNLWRVVWLLVVHHLEPLAKSVLLLALMDELADIDLVS